jgi:ribosomal protein S18 acetylase RimI-like enzyme
MEISYRDGKKQDCNAIAEFADIASEGVIEFLFHDLIPDMTPVQLVAHSLENDASYYSYKNTIVAEYEDKVVGILLSYPSHFHQITEELKNFLPEDRLEHFRSYYSARIENSLFLNALCVDERFRSKGIGTELIFLTKKKAEKSGYRILSLIVLGDNTGAQRLYQRCGFEVEEHIDLKSHELIPHEGGCLLMKYNLEG